MTEHNRTLLVMGVCCSTEEVVLRKRLDQAIGSEGYSFNPITSELKCRAHISAEALVSEVRAAGFDAREKKSMLKQEPFLRRHAIGLRTLGALMIGCAGGFLYENGAGDVGVGLLILSILVGGVATFRKAVLALRQGSLDMNTLMSVAVLGAMAIKRWEEGAAVIVLYSVSVMLEAYSTQRTRKAVASLMDVSPEEAFLMHETEEHRVPASSIRPGDHVLVKPGGRVPIDGVVIEGSSTVSEALLTGESAPVDKQTGSLVFAGCLNHGGALIVKAEKAFEETRLSHILHLIEEAQHKKAPVQTSVERFAAIYTKAVLGIALTVAVVPPLLFGGSVFVWLYRALVTIVIACPCALVIATPVALVSALTTAARSGILLKGGRTLEQLASTKAMVFDKTGTLTHGELAVTDIVPLNGIPWLKLLQLFAEIESRSEHPLSSAILRKARREGVDCRSFSPVDFDSVTGKGIRATVEGRSYFAGNCAMAIDHGITDESALAAMRTLEEQGKTVVMLGSVGEPIGLIAASDISRERLPEIMARLRAEGIQHLALYSGDTSSVVDRMRIDADLDHAGAGMLPEKKLESIRALQDEFGPVAMVGDGVNDAPALAGATVGIAMGARAADVALETADVVLMGSRLDELPGLLSLSRETMRVVHQNIVFAIVVKVVFLVLAATGFATLWLAILADDGAALLVIANAVRLLKQR